MDCRLFFSFINRQLVKRSIDSRIGEVEIRSFVGGLGADRTRIGRLRSTVNVLAWPWHLVWTSQLQVAES